jgi:putative ATP-binding cassette transporter
VGRGDETKPETGDASAHATFLASGVKTDPRSQKLDKVFFRRLWSLCRPYWTRDGAWRSYILAVVIIGVGLAGTAAGGWMTLLFKDVNNALVAKDVAGYWSFWLMYSGLGLAVFMTSLVAGYLEAYLEVDWRRWMTTRLVDEYLGERTYYSITLDGDIDNPDQRIQEEMKPVIDAVTRLPNNLLNAVMNIAVQVGILAFIAMPMLFATLAYCTINAVVTYFINKPTIRQNWDSTVAEADLRFGLLHVRDHAETIAFYRGENGERVHLLDRLSRAITTQWKLVRYQVAMSLATKMMSLVWTLLPLLFVAPLYFTGKIEFGTIAAATTAAALINASMYTFIQFIPLLSKSVPHVVRVAEVREKFDRLKTYNQAQHIGHLRREVGGEIVRFDNVTLMTPGGERALFRNVSLEVTKGGTLLIAGPTGTGKSSALRAMAGMWKLGQGTILAPREEETVYLPQRPYMVLGSLRHQLLYPGNAAVPPTDEQIVTALREACLDGLVERHPDLSTEADWGRILSLGEQQRIGFARAYLTGAHYVFLDEATSAVDVGTERRLYQGLLSRNITLVSVGHRPTLFAYHDRVLDLRPDGTGEVVSIDRYLAKLEGADAQPPPKAAVVTLHPSPQPQPTLKVGI